MRGSSVDKEDRNWMAATVTAQRLAPGGGPAIGQLRTHQTQVSSLAQAIDQLGKTSDGKQANVLAMKKPLKELAWGGRMECSDDGLHRRILSLPRLENLVLEEVGQAGKEKDGGATRERSRTLF